MRVHRDRGAARLGIHIDKRVVRDRDVVRHAALDVGEVAVDLDAAALAREPAVADRARTRLDQQPLVIVLEVAPHHPPAGARVIRPFDDRVGERRNRPVRGHGMALRASHAGFAQRLAGVAVAEQQPVAGGGVAEDRAVELAAAFEGHAVARQILDVAPVAVEIGNVVGRVADHDAVERRAVASRIEHEPFAALPLADTGTRAEIAVPPDVRPVAAVLGAPRFGGVHLDAIHRQFGGADEFQRGSHRVDAREPVADAEESGVADGVEQLRVGHRHPGAALGGGG